MAPNYICPKCGGEYYSFTDGEWICNCGEPLVKSPPPYIDVQYDTVKELSESWEQFTSKIRAWCKTILRR